MRNRKAFTLVEVLITLALLSVILAIAYEAIVHMFRSGTVTTWESNLTTQFTNADSRLRDYLNGSSYPSLVSPQGNSVLNGTDAFVLGVAGANGTPPKASFKAVTSRTVMMSWYRLEAGRQGIEGLPNTPPQGNFISLVAVPSGATKVKNIPEFDLVMEEQPVTFPTDPAAFQNVTAGSANGALRSTKMVGDCSEVNITLFTRTPGLPTKDRVQVEVEIKCVEPSQGNAERSRKITAEANVGAKAI